MPLQRVFSLKAGKNNIHLFQQEVFFNTFAKVK